MIVLVGGEKGGTGKTTLAIHLAAVRLGRPRCPPGRHRQAGQRQLLVRGPRRGGQGAPGRLRAEVRQGARRRTSGPWQPNTATS